MSDTPSSVLLEVDAAIHRLWQNPRNDYLQDAHRLARKLSRVSRGPLRHALKLHMEWIGPPPTDKHSYDSLREDAWKAGVAAIDVEGDK